MPETEKDHTQGFTLKCGLYSCCRPKRIGQKLVFMLIPNRNTLSGVFFADYTSVSKGSHAAMVES